MQNREGTNVCVRCVYMGVRLRFLVHVYRIKEREKGRRRPIFKGKSQPQTLYSTVIGNGSSISGSVFCYISCFRR